MSVRLTLAFALGIVLVSACGGQARARVPLSVAIPALDGGVIDVQRYRGRPVVIHLFATWSLAAQSDVMELKALADERGDEVTIIGVALDQDGYRLVAPWRRANDIRYLVGLVSPALASGGTALGRIHAVPTTIILSADGTIAHRLERPLVPGELRELVRGLGPGR